MRALFKFYDLRIRQLFFISLIFLLYIFLDFVFITPFLLDYELKREIELQKDVATVLTDELEDYLENAIAELREFSLSEEFLSGNLSKIDKKVVELNRLSSFFDDIFIVNEDGVWISFPHSINLVGQKLSTFDWLYETLKKDDVLFNDVIPQTRRNIPVAGVSIKIKGGFLNGKQLVIRGTFVVDNDSKLHTLIKRFKFGNNGYSYLASKNGYLISYGGNEEGVHSLLNFNERLPVRETLLSEKKEILFFDYKKDKEEYLAFSKRLRTSGWILVVEQPKQDVIKRIKFYINSYRIFILIFILLFSILTLVSIQYPINAIYNFLDLLKKRKNLLDSPFKKPKDQVEEIIFSISLLFNELYSSKREIDLLFQKYKAILDNSSDWIWEIDVNGIFTYSSQSVEKILGYAANEVIGKSFFDLMIDEDRDVFKREFSYLIEARKPIVNFKNTLFHKDGHKVIIEISGTPFFSEDSTILGYRGVNRDITERYSYLKALERALNEKELLIAEIQHRIKNNLYVISSIIQLQANYVKNKKVVSVLNDTIARINAISFIHQKLYNLSNLSSINLKELFEAITNSVLSYYNTRNVQCVLHIDDISLNINKILPCSLILNELLTNSLKHGFIGKNRVGVITVSFSYNNDKYILKVSDNGVGVKKTDDIFMSDSVGMKLIRDLTKQLDGKLEFYNDNGLTVTITFKD